jgi:hypothetical protein
MLEHGAAVIDLAFRQAVAKRRRAFDDDVSQRPRPHPLTRGTEALEAEHVRAVRPDVTVIAVFRPALTAGGAKVTVLATMMATGHGEPPFDGVTAGRPEGLRYAHHREGP